MADGTDMAAVIWLDHDRIRLYGASEQNVGVDWIDTPKTVTTI